MDDDQIPEHLRRFAPDTKANVPGANLVDYSPTFVNTLSNIAPKLKSIWFVYGVDHREYPVAIFRTAEECLRWLQETSGFYMGYNVIEWSFDTPDFETAKRNE